MKRRCQRTVLVAWGLLTVSALSGCTVDLFDEETTETTVAERVAPSETFIVQNRFCDTMSQVRIDALEGVDRSIAETTATYIDLLPDVPGEIVDDFKAMIEELGGTLPVSAADGSAGPSDTTGASTPTESTTNDAPAESNEVATGPLDGEVWVPESSPIARVFSYVELTCTGTANNPGPQATAPP